MLVASSVTLELARQRIGGPFDRLGHSESLLAAKSREWLSWYPHHARAGLRLSRGTVSRLAAALAAQGVLSRHESEQLLLLRAHRAARDCTCSADSARCVYALRCLRTDDGPRPVERARRGRALLALHGGALDLSARRARAMGMTHLLEET